MPHSLGWSPKTSTLTPGTIHLKVAKEYIEVPLTPGTICLKYLNKEGSEGVQAAVGDLLSQVTLTPGTIHLKVTKEEKYPIHLVKYTWDSSIRKQRLWRRALAQGITHLLATII
jgi:uncharacterized protein YehS (DUF1456 family)